jgi:hypothetical protein
VMNRTVFGCACQIRSSSNPISSRVNAGLSGETHA